MSGSRGAWLLSSIFLLTTCCAHVEHRSGTPEKHLIAGVPFNPDTTDQCGPSTLASVITFAGVPTTPQVLKKEIYIPKLKGTLPMDMLPAVEERGLKAQVYNGSLEDVREKIRSGSPLVAYLNLGLTVYPIGHYIVVTGFDDSRQGIYAHSAGKPNQFISYRKFLRSWDKTDRWTLWIEGGQRT